MCSQNLNAESPKLAMIVPCYNEELRLNPDYWNYIISKTESIKWYFVDDGSNDNTISLLNSLDERCRVLQLADNKGKGEAIRFGLNQALITNMTIGAIGYVDSDMAFSRDEILEFCLNSLSILDLHDRIDAVIASRVKLAGAQIDRSTNRHFLARIIATIFGIFWSDIPYDTQCGLKVFRFSPAVKDSISLVFQTRWLFDIEFFARISKFNGKNVSLIELPIKFWKEIGGSKLSGMEYIRIAKELVTILGIIQICFKATKK